MKKKAERLNLLFRMVGLDISNENCLLIHDALKQYKKKKGKFTLSDGCKLQAKYNQDRGPVLQSCDNPYHNAA